MWSENKVHAYVGDQDYDFTWLDPEKKIYVLQNRRYRKGKKLEFAIGPLDVRLNNTLVSAFGATGRLTWYPNEEWGVEALYKYKFNRKSGAAEHFENETGFRGLPRQTNWYGALELLWVPFYSKINTFNHIFYIDLGGGAGPAWIETEADRNLFKGVVQANSIEVESTYGALVTVFIKFYFNEHFGLRHDINWLNYRALQVTPINSKSARSYEWWQDWDYNLSFTVLF